MNSSQFQRDTLSSAKSTSISWYLGLCRVSMSSHGSLRFSLQRRRHLRGPLILHDSSEFRAAFLWPHLQFLPAPLQIIHLSLNSFRAALYYCFTYLRFQFPLNHVCSTLSSCKVILLDREDRSKLGLCSLSSVNIIPSTPSHGPIIQPLS